MLPYCCVTASLPDCLTTWLSHYLTASLPDCLTPNYLTAWLPQRLTASLTHRFTAWLPHLLTAWLPHWLTDSLFCRIRTKMKVSRSDHFLSDFTISKVSQTVVNIILCRSKYDFLMKRNYSLICTTVITKRCWLKTAVIIIALFPHPLFTPHPLPTCYTSVRKNKCWKGESLLPPIDKINNIPRWAKLIVFGIVPAKDQSHFSYGQFLYVTEFIQS